MLALLTYRGDRRRPSRAAIAWSSSACGSRCSALLVFCLFRPTLVLKAAVPQQNFVGVLVDDSRSMSIADTNGQTAQRVRAAAVDRAEREAAQGAVAALRPAVLQLRVVVGSRRVGGGPEVRRHGDAARPGARSRARRAVRSAARRARHGDRRRRHVGRRARRAAREPQGAIDSGVHGRRRPGALRARHSGHARRNAARRPQGHVARRRRRALADRLRRPDASRSTSKTKAAS